MSYSSRRSIRLEKYDYAADGGYFVTICARKRECLFGEVVEGKVVLSEMGEVVEKVWNEIPIRFSHVKLDEFVIMPNHLHGILVFCRGEPCVRPILGISSVGEHRVRPYGTNKESLGRIIQDFKTGVVNRYINGVLNNRFPPFKGQIFQRNYHEHIIRDSDDLNRIREYILTNPLHWDEDKENPLNASSLTLSS